MAEPAPAEATAARARIHADLDRWLDFHEANRTEGFMYIEIPLTGGRPRRFEVNVLDRRQPAPAGRKSLTPKRN